MNLPASKSSITTTRLKALLCAALAPLLLATHAVGAVISWQTPVNVDLNDPTQVLNNGTTFTVYDVGNVHPTLNGVDFTYGNYHPFSAIPISYGGSSGLTPSSATPYSTILPSLAAIYDSTSASGASIVFGAASGINAHTIGQTYELQIWVGYSYPPIHVTANRFSDAAPSINVGDGLYHASNESGNVVPANTGAETSQFVVGTFVADATTQNLFYYGDTTPPNYPDNSLQGEFAALQLRTIAPIPEPQTWALAALGASAVLFRLRRQQRAA